jgi:hypothetical protein
MVSDTSFHCWRHAQSLMNPAKVVMEKMQGARVLVVLNFLAESVCQSGESAVAHSQRQILTFNETG